MITDDQILNKKNIPQAVEVESKILGGILYENGNIEQVKMILQPDHFFKSEHRKIYSAMLELYDKGIGIDTVSLYENLKGEVNPQTIAGLSNDITSVAMVDYHTRVVYEKFLLRKIIQLGMKLETSGYADGDPFELITDAEIDLSKLLVESSRTEKKKDLVQELDAYFYDLKDRIEKGEDDSIKFRHFNSVNIWTSGVRLGDYISIQGQDKSAKSHFALSTSLDVGINKRIPIAYFSYEINNVSNIHRTVSNLTGIDYKLLRNPFGTKGHGRMFAKSLDLQELDRVAVQTVSKLQGTKIYLEDEPYNEDELISRIVLLAKEYGVKWFVIDYIGLIPENRRYNSREERIASISRKLYNLNKKLNTIMIMISQQNRDGGIAESKALERDPDFVFSIEKPYDPKSNVQITRQIMLDDVQSFMLEPTPNDFIITIKRSRHGVQGYQCLAQFVNNKFQEVDKVNGYQEGRDYQAPPVPYAEDNMPYPDNSEEKDDFI